MISFRSPFRQKKNHSQISRTAILFSRHAREIWPHIEKQGRTANVVNPWGVIESHQSVRSSLPCRDVKILVECPSRNDWGLEPQMRKRSAIVLIIREKRARLAMPAALIKIGQSLCESESMISPSSSLELLCDPKRYILVQDVDINRDEENLWKWLVWSSAVFRERFREASSFC